MTNKLLRMRRIMLAFAASGHLDRTNLQAHELDQLQVSQLCGTAHGLAVVPSHGVKKDGRCTCDDEKCKHPGRHPRTCLQDATTDGELIHQFWTQSPKAKVIVATGQQGIIAVTVRGRKGQQALESLANDDDVETIEFRGRHLHTYLLRAPDDAIPNGRLRLAEGVVVHGRGSFILVPRNVSRPGRAKQLFDGEIASAPSWLLRVLGSPARSDTPQLEKDGGDMPPERDDEDTDNPERLTISERTFAETLDFDLFRLDLEWIVVPDGSPACDAKKVQALADSYRITGVRAPLAVRELAERTEDSDPVFSLVSDPSRLEALKRLGIRYAHCYVIKGDEADERLWKLADLIHQPHVKALDWALLVMEWVALVREKGGQVAHPRGGRQPHDKGMSAAARVLGVSRRDLGRAERFASICPDAQAVIRQAKLDDIQVALEEIANEPAGQQVEKALEVKERYRKPRRNRVTIVDTTPDTGQQQGQVPEAESPDLAPDHHDSDEETEEEKPVESPDTAPGEPSGDIDQPSALGRRAGDDEKFEIVTSLWDQYIADEWDDASEKMHLQFFKHLGYTVVARSKNRKLHH